jgi:Na+/melibiose symporter-like transporter
LETHRKFTFVGAILLVITFLINYYHQENHPDVGFNYAYVTGVLMLVAFSVSLVLFTKNHS